MNTKEGGAKVAKTNKARYGEDFYQRIGGLNHDSWVANGRKPKGFAWMKANGMSEKISEAGRKGGKISRRGRYDKTKDNSNNSVPLSS